ncbi:MAG: flagellar type III secretion system pore protein FliP [Myxococcales bacterium]|nr:flagellar type III secretion system pore protein FliP [Myxococcota bacterium]MDW8283359.1 flagellar type III secretion system pore protein FliP [Myxococcales bacterium]
MFLTAPLIDLPQAGSGPPLLGPVGSAQALRLVVLLGALSLLPTILLTLTCFTRIVVVLSFLRHGLGTQGVPPNQVIVGLSLFLTAFIMAPTAEAVYRNAVRPYMDNQLGEAQALQAASAPLRRFLLPQTRESDLMLFYRLAGERVPDRPDEVQLRMLVPAFVISELRTACEMGFLILIPFLIIDLLVASLLTALGMVMVPPGPVSLPLKLLLFVLVDGWSLMVSSLARSFGG